MEQVLQIDTDASIGQPEFRATTQFPAQFLAASRRIEQVGAGQSEISRSVGFSLLAFWSLINEAI